MKTYRRKISFFLTLLVLPGLFFAVPPKMEQFSRKDKKEQVLEYGKKMLHALFQDDCHTFEEMLAEPFYFLSYGNIPRHTYADFICNDFRSGMSRIPAPGFTWEDYLKSYHRDVFHSSEFGMVLDRDGGKVDLNKIFAEAKKPFVPTDDDYLFFGGRLQEGVAPLKNINFGWTYYLIRFHADGRVEAVGVID